MRSGQIAHSYIDQALGRVRAAGLGRLWESELLFVIVALVVPAAFTSARRSGMHVAFGAGAHSGRLFRFHQVVSKSAGGQTPYILARSNKSRA